MKKEKHQLQEVIESIKPQIDTSKLCVVLGSGPSAELYRDEFWDKDKHFTIGVNSIAKIIDEVDILFVQDRLSTVRGRSVERTNMLIEAVEVMKKTKCKFFVSRPHRDSTSIIEHLKLEAKGAERYSIEEMSNSESVDSAKSLRVGTTSPIGALVLAYKLGFKEIIIAGMDLVRKEGATDTDRLEGFATTFDSVELAQLQLEQVVYQILMSQNMTIWRYSEEQNISLLTYRNRCC